MNKKYKCPICKKMNAVKLSDGIIVCNNIPECGLMSIPKIKGNRRKQVKGGLRK